MLIMTLLTSVFFVLFQTVGTIYRHTPVAYKVYTELHPHVPSVQKHQFIRLCCALYYLFISLLRRIQWVLLSLDWLLHHT